jgi:hypothetical protein
LRRLNGDQAAMDDQKQMVAALLGSVEGPAKQLAQAIATDSVVMNDWYLHKMLVTHATGVGRFYRTRMKQ